MRCKCKNADGTLSEKCFGTCKLDVILEQEAQQQRDPLSGFAEMVLAQVEKRIDLRIAQVRVEFASDQMSLWKRAFMEGLREGINIRAENSEDY